MSPVTIDIVALGEWLAWGLGIVMLVYNSAIALSKPWKAQKEKEVLERERLLDRIHKLEVSIDDLIDEHTRYETVQQQVSGSLEKQIVLNSYLIRGVDGLIKNAIDKNHVAQLKEISLEFDEVLYRKTGDIK